MNQVPHPAPIRFGAAVAEYLAAHDQGKPTAMGTRLRYSRAGSCAFDLALEAAGVPESNPMDLAGQHVANIGTVGHEQWQKAMKWRFPDCQVDAEVPSKLTVDDIDVVSGSADMTMLFPDGYKIVLELKHMGGAGWRRAAGFPDKGDKRSKAHGPRDSAILQGCLNGLALDADEVVWPLLSYEAISVQRAQRLGIDERQRFVSEWSMTREEYEPIARAELERLHQILEMVDRGWLPERAIPTWGSGTYDPYGQVIDDPVTSRHWLCSGYCNRADVCKSLGSEPSLADVQIGVGR